METLLWELIREWPNGATEREGTELQDELADVDYHADWLAEVAEFGGSEG